MIRLDEFDIPRPGWPGRRRAIAKLVVQMFLGTIFLIALLAIAFAYIWLGAPEGAGVAGVSSRHQGDDPTQHDVPRRSTYRAPSSGPDRPVTAGGVDARRRDQTSSPALDTAARLRRTAGPAT